MTWKRGEIALKPADIEDLMERALDLAAKKMDFDRIDPEAIQRSEASVMEIMKSSIEAAAQPSHVVGLLADRDKMAEQLYKECLTYGPLTAFLADPSITEIMANGSQKIFVERTGALEETRRRFRSDLHLLHVIRLITALLGRPVDDLNPYVDGRLPDGSRLHAIIPPLAVDGPALTIRKFSRSVSSLADLAKLGCFPADVAEFLLACSRGRLNIIVSGGTNTGKTTLLNALAEGISDNERVITIEDACELQLKKRNLVRLETKPADLEGRGEVSTRTLLRNALRMRPTRILVGEVRGPECFDMLQAMNTGHNGSMTTVHANSPRDALARLESLALLADVGIPFSAIRRQMASAVHLVIQLDRLPDGSRRITKVTELIGMEGDVVTSQDLFEMKFDKPAGTVLSAVAIGTLKPTGLIPKFEAVLEQRGIKISRSVYNSTQK